MAQLTVVVAERAAVVRAMEQVALVEVVLVEYTIIPVGSMVPLPVLGQQTLAAAVVAEISLMVALILDKQEQVVAVEC
jgi:hypothetical protein